MKAFIPLLVYLINSWAVNGKPITNYANPTVNPTSIMLTFDSRVSSIYFSDSFMKRAINITAISPIPMDLSNYTISILTDDFRVARVDFPISEILPSTTFKLEYKLSEASQDDYIENKELYVKMAPYDANLSSKSNLDSLSSFDTVLGIFWMIASIILMILQPSSLFYMQTKLTLETMDVFRMTNIDFPYSLNYYYSQSNHRTVGFRLPNIFAIAIHGDDYSSGYSGDESYINYGSRTDDVRLHVSSSKLLQSYKFPLFLDNYGTQIIVFFFIILINIAIHFVRQYRVRKNKDIFGFFLYRFKYFSGWNFFIACFIGSYMAGLYYSLIQFSVLIKSEKTYNNTLSFAFSVICFVIFWISPCYLWNLIDDAQNVEGRVRLKYSILYEQFNSQSRVGTEILFWQILRTLLFAVLLVFSEISAVVQTIIPLFVSAVFILTIVFYRPYANRSTHLFMVTTESLFLIYIFCYFVLATMDSQTNLNLTAREAFGAISIMVWILLPITTLGFSVYEIKRNLIKIREDRNVNLLSIPNAIKKPAIVIVSSNEALEKSAKKENPSPMESRHYLELPSRVASQNKIDSDGSGSAEKGSEIDASPTLNSRMQSEEPSTPKGHEENYMQALIRKQEHSDLESPLASHDEPLRLKIGPKVPSELVPIQAESKESEEDLKQEETKNNNEKNSKKPKGRDKKKKPTQLPQLRAPAKKKTTIKIEGGFPEKFNMYAGLAQDSTKNSDSAKSKSTSKLTLPEPK